MLPPFRPHENMKWSTEVFHWTLLKMVALSTFPMKISEKSPFYHLSILCTRMLIFWNKRKARTLLKLLSLKRVKFLQCMIEMLMRVNKCCHVLPFHGRPYLKVTFCTTILGSLSPDSLFSLIFEHNYCTKANPLTNWLWFLQIIQWQIVLKQNRRQMQFWEQKSKTQVLQTLASNFQKYSHWMTWLNQSTRYWTTRSTQWQLIKTQRLLMLNWEIESALARTSRSSHSMTILAAGLRDETKS